LSQQHVPVTAFGDCIRRLRTECGRDSRAEISAENRQEDRDTSHFDPVHHFDILRLTIPAQPDPSGMASPWITIGTGRFSDFMAAKTRPDSNGELPRSQRITGCGKYRIRRLIELGAVARYSRRTKAKGLRSYRRGGIG
jgi:hypothetical protein